VTGKRTRYSAEFKAKVALETLRGERGQLNYSASGLLPRLAFRVPADPLVPTPVAADERLVSGDGALVENGGDGRISLKNSVFYWS
jgi:hypothetical protein